ncbi:hypothetical protein LTR36_008007 [Oleoguttula mirabilis]|uniref:F-box domain-containing protein n=1 Tax=Oleoguttula mirabilis TaxID=1507867 RepID=A0AAV9J8Y9_9PEZI|nr:hypothetical protein LTR36_008007 [Oleoguttula mirabilis]
MAMLPPPPPSYPPAVTRRPLLPRNRAHTLYASASDYIIAEEVETEEEDGGVDVDDDEEGEEEDDQTTPRASLAGLSILPDAIDNESLSRDDTAADVSMLAASHYGEASAKARRHPPGVEPHTQFSTWSRSGAFREPRAGTLRVPPAHTIPSSSAGGDGFAGQTKQVRSLGRRFSRNYKEKMAELKDGLTKSAPFSNRMRRASTPLNAEPGLHANERFADPRQALAPLSPSKRNARHAGDYRARKFRSPFGLAGSDRKDTPAPPPFGLAARPAPRPATAAAAWQLPGGDGARRAAAASRHGGMQWARDGAWPQQGESLDTRRGRVGSLSSAADSGADLGTFGEDSCKDSVGDADDMDLDDEPEMEERPARQDFVETLPSEIALQIFEYLDARDLMEARCVGPEWKAMTDEASVWRASYLRKYDRRIYTEPAPIQVGGAGIGRTNKPNQEWKKMYKARLELEQNWRKGAAEAGKAIYLSGHTDSVYCLQFDEEKIITGSRDRTIRVWDMNTFQCLRVIGGPAVKPVLGPKVLRTVDYPAFHLATASINGTHYGDSIYHTPAQWHDASILCLQYDDEILVTGSSDSDLIVWDIHTYEPLHRLRKHTGGVLDVALDRHHIISCSKDSRIIVWDRKTFEPKGDLTGHRGPVNAVQLRGNFLVSASGDGIARLWDLTQMKLIQEFSAKERGLAAVEFSEDMKYVLAGGNDHITYKFEVATGQEVQQFTGHTQLVRSLWLDSANARVVSGSYDLDLRVYDFATGAELWRAEEWTTSWMLAAKSDYRRIVATSQDGRILIVDFGLQKGGFTDGMPIENVELLRGVERTNAIVFRNPWVDSRRETAAAEGAGAGTGRLGGLGVA